MCWEGRDEGEEREEGEERGETGEEGDGERRHTHK